jgi:hypothetical protein
MKWFSKFLRITSQKQDFFVFWLKGGLRRRGKGRGYQGKDSRKDCAPKKERRVFAQKQLEEVTKEFDLFKNKIIICIDCLCGLGELKRIEDAFLRALVRFGAV